MALAWVRVVARAVLTAWSAASARWVAEAYRARFGKAPRAIEGDEATKAAVSAALAKARFTDQEVRTLRGVISSLDRKHERPKPDRGPGNKGERNKT